MCAAVARSRVLFRTRSPDAPSVASWIRTLRHYGCMAEAMADWSEMLEQLRAMRATVAPTQVLCVVLNQKEVQLQNEELEISQQ